ncbi:MAG: response regulator [Candidatus Obscuribacterales bacterium]|nr:response regulator [Candidatus Obscuribacterales bacterium]
MHVLLVEDDPVQSRATQVRLEQRGLVIDRAMNCQQAINRLDSGPVDVVLLDLTLPDSPGIETFYRIREAAGKIPIVVLTGLNDQDIALETVKNGAQDYLVKGLASDDSIIRCLHYAIERNKVEAALRASEKRLRVILQNSYDAFISMDSRFHIRDWNVQAEKTFGWRHQDILGKAITAIVPRHLRKQYLRHIANYFNQNPSKVLRMNDEIIASSKDGHEFPIEIVIFRTKEEEDDDYMYCAFVRDITERKQANEELERRVQERTEELTRSNEELRQFAKVASHDLQEPLRAVQGFANLLADGARDKLDKDSQEFIDYILDGTQRMQQLIQSVLLHSSVTYDDESENTISTDCDSAMEEVLANLNASVNETGAQLDIDNLPDVAVERWQVIQLFQNLISNAIKYRGQEAPRIHVSAERTVNDWLFSVRDNGIGIDAKYSDKIFDMFARLHGKTKYSGTGMGLAICKKIVASHGGKIWVESEVGNGSIFLFTLPAADKPQRRVEMENNIEILLVEDTPSDIRLTQEALKRSDLKYTLNVVNDGVEAMEYLNKLKGSPNERLPDIILLDLNMPRKNGHEVLTEIKDDPVLRKIAVVLLTVSQREEDVMEALKLKMNYYLAKPVTAQKLSVLIKSIHSLQYERDLSLASGQADDEKHVRLVLAGNPHTSPSILNKLASDENRRIRSRVAENPETPMETLLRLAEDSDPDVRLSVSENPKVPLSILKKLAEDPCEDVRLGIAGNNRMPLDILETLSDDENTFVASSASGTISNLPGGSLPALGR